MLERFGERRRTIIIALETSADYQMIKIIILNNSHKFAQFLNLNYIALAGTQRDTELRNLWITPYAEFVKTYSKTTQRIKSEE